MIDGIELKIPLNFAKCAVQCNEFGSINTITYLIVLSISPRVSLSDNWHVSPFWPCNDKGQINNTAFTFECHNIFPRLINPTGCKESDF